MLQIESAIRECLPILLCFVRLKPFRPDQTIAGLWDAGVTVVLGEMDVTGEVIPFLPVSTPSARGLVPNPAVSQSPNSVRQCEICYLSGGRRPPEPNYVGRRGMGDDIWRGQNEGLLRNTF